MATVSTSLALSLLETGPIHRFRDWPNPEIPRVAAGVYTVWHSEQLIYVGMAGRGLSAQSIASNRAQPTRGTGLYSRLNSHASGRRSGDQFCIYVCDRCVLPMLSHEQIARIATGQLSLDALVRQYIHAHLGYRYLQLPDGSAALRLETSLRQGALAAGQPLFNPL